MEKTLKNQELGKPKNKRSKKSGGHRIQEK